MYRTIFDLSKKEWSGIHRKSVYNPSVSIGAILLDVMTLTPNKVSQVNERLKPNKVNYLNNCLFYLNRLVQTAAFA